MAPGKVKGPGGGLPESGQLEGNGPEGQKVGGKDEAAPTGSQGSRFAEKLTSSQASGRVDQAAEASRAKEISGSLAAHLAADLKAGKITAQAAIDRVIDGVLEKQLGSNAPAPVREKLRAALETAVADDPLLSEKIRSLGST